MTYKETPAALMRLIQLFHEQQLSYLLFKCEHLFSGENKNLDILFETEEDYHRAALLLEQRGFILRFSEKFEKYKLMYCGFVQSDIGEQTFHSIHLHREIAWHGMIALDKKEVFNRKKIITPLIVVPGLESSILIHAAHVLFENFKITDRERTSLSQLENANAPYLKQQANKNNWGYGFKKIKAGNLSRSTIALTWMQKLMHEPKTAIYLSKKIFKRVVRHLLPRKRGTLITLIGVNGTGKTTLAKKTLELYAPYTLHLGYPQYYYYFGWKPDFFLTKFISWILQKKKKNIFSTIALKPQRNKFSLFQELLFLYCFGEFYYRYIVKIKLKLHRKSLVVCDRYFYDLYGQYPYAAHSRIINLLLKLFPQPDYTFLLTASLEKIQRRGKEEKLASAPSSMLRKVLPEQYLQKQVDNYGNLQQIVLLSEINTEQDLATCAKNIIEQTWREVV